MAHNNKDRSLFLSTLAEKPFILYASKKAGISRATIYRWMKDNPDFRTQVDTIIREGRVNLTDSIEMRLVKSAMDGNFNAMKFYLEHNTKEYRPQRADLPAPIVTPEQWEILKSANDWIRHTSPSTKEETLAWRTWLKRVGYIDSDGQPSEEFKKLMLYSEKEKTLEGKRLGRRGGYYHSVVDLMRVGHAEEPPKPKGKDRKKRRSLN